MEWVQYLKFIGYYTLPIISSFHIIDLFLYPFLFISACYLGFFSHELKLGNFQSI